jgi:hypothetical protein
MNRHHKKPRPFPSGTALRQPLPWITWRRGNRSRRPNRRSLNGDLFLERLEDRLCLDSGLNTVAINEFPLAGGGPSGITAGTDGALWFTEDGGAIGRIDPSTHQVESYSLPLDPTYHLPAAPVAITSGPDNALWFTESLGREKLIGRLDPNSHTITQYVIPGLFSYDDSTGITTGPDGGIWFTESYANAIGRIDPNTHAISQFAIPVSASYPTRDRARPGWHALVHRV